MCKNFYTLNLKKNPVDFQRGFSFYGGMAKTNKAPVEVANNPFAKYDIVSKGTEGIKMFIETPDGKTSETDFLIVRSTDCEAFVKAGARFNKERLESLQKDAKKAGQIEPGAAAIRDKARESKLVSNLVADWSFDVPCTEANILNLFASAPYIQEQVDAVGSEQKNFFG